MKNEKGTTGAEILENPVKNLRIIGGFFTKTGALKMATNQRAIAKEKGLVIDKVVVEDAYRFYVANLWFRKSLKEMKRKIPAVGEYMVIVYPEAVIEISEKVKVPKVKEVVAVEIPMAKTISVPVMIKKVVKKLASFLPTKSIKQVKNRFSTLHLISLSRQIMIELPQIFNRVAA